MSEKFKYRSVLAPYMEMLVKTKEAAGQSAMRMKWILKEFDDFAESMGLTDPQITQEFIMRWRNTRINDCDNTLYYKWSVWSQLTQLMCRCGCTCHVPKLPRQPQSSFVPYIFTEDQIGKIFDALDSLRLYDIRMGTGMFSFPALFRLLYATGVRISEALSIRNEDVHLGEQYILLRKTKNKHERMVPVSDSLKLVLETYLSYRSRIPVDGLDAPDHVFFVKADGTEILQGSVYSNFRKILKKCGIPFQGDHHGPRVHDLRHTFAVHALVKMSRAGKDLYTALPILSAILGHTSLSATEQYVRLTVSMFPELEAQCSPVCAFVYPKLSRYDD